MSAEFRLTSEFRDLKEIAYERNASTEWRSVFEVKPSIGRIVKLRGRLPTSGDLPDILYDLNDYADISLSREALMGHLSSLIQLEATYYPLAENFGTRTALSLGHYERVPDFIDVAKDLVARIVWSRWKTEKGEDFIVLHKKILHELKRGLVFGWDKNVFYKPFSSQPNHELAQATPFQDLDANSPQPKPIYRLRAAAEHLSLPSIIAGIEKTKTMEQVASLTLLGYYPDGRGFIGVAGQLGIKRKTLTQALDRANDQLLQTPDGILPQRGIKDIVEDLLQTPVMRYPSGKNVQRTNPRIKLFDLGHLPEGISPFERKIVTLATIHHQGTFSYSSEDIATEVGSSKPIVCRVIKRVASSLQQDVHQ